MRIKCITNTGAALSPQTVRQVDCEQVAVVLAAVEMRANPTQCDFVTLLDGDAPPLPGNAVVFSESFDTDPGDAWELSNSGVYPEYSPRDWIWTEDTPDGDGGAFFALDSVRIGDCRPGSDDQSGVMRLTSPPITILQGTVDPILAFDHWMASEAAWDGGNPMDSVNGPCLTPKTAFDLDSRSCVSETGYWTSIKNSGRRLTFLNCGLPFLSNL